MHKRFVTKSQISVCEVTKGMNEVIKYRQRAPDGILFGGIREISKTEEFCLRMLVRQHKLKTLTTERNIASLNLVYKQTMLALL